MFRSATFKLTLYYLGLTMAISLMFSVVLYRLASNDISRGIYLQSQRIYNQFPVFRDSQILKPRSDITSGIHVLLVRLILFNLVVFLLAGVFSYLLAKTTLKPIEEAHEQQKRFTADVSHELRTPLTALRMESEVALLTKDSSTNDLRNTIESNLEEVSKLEQLINSILRLTRLEYDELRQNFVKTNVKDIAQNAANQLQKLAERRDIKIETSLKSGQIEGDPDSLTQLLVILLDNAIKYSSSKSSITLKSFSSSKGTGFSVEDHGIGIDKEALDHIFDRFYRANNSRTKSVDNEGHGLGLSIAKTITDIHGAVITVSSQLAKGTTVTVLFSQDK